MVKPNNSQPRKGGSAKAPVKGGSSWRKGGVSTVKGDSKKPFSKRPAGGAGKKFGGKKWAPKDREAEERPHYLPKTQRPKPERAEPKNARGAASLKKKNQTRGSGAFVVKPGESSAWAKERAAEVNKKFSKRTGSNTAKPKGESGKSAEKKDDDAEGNVLTPERIAELEELAAMAPTKWAKKKLLRKAHGWSPKPKDDAERGDEAKDASDNEEDADGGAAKQSKRAKVKFRTDVLERTDRDILDAEHRARKRAMVTRLAEGDVVGTEADWDAVGAVLPSLSAYEMTELSNDKSHLSARWTNKQRVLLLGSRGMKTIHRYLLRDLRNLLPHHKKEIKWDKREDPSELMEAADGASCNNILYLESRKRRYMMWLGKTPSGPSVKFNVLSVHTSEGVNYIGNCLKYSRPLLVFDKWFGDLTQLRLIKELFVQVLGTPRYHPAAKPFHDHVLSFFYNDGIIWVRHYQIVPNHARAESPVELREIGPRFCLKPLRIFASTFEGATLWKNPTVKWRSMDGTSNNDDADKTSEDDDESAFECDIFTDDDGEEDNADED